jgi:hypothetical protein
MLAKKLTLPLNSISDLPSSGDDESSDDDGRDVDGNDDEGRARIRQVTIVDDDEAIPMIKGKTQQKKTKKKDHDQMEKETRVKQQSKQSSTRKHQTPNPRLSPAHSLSTDVANLSPLKRSSTPSLEKPSTSMSISSSSSSQHRSKTRRVLDDDDIDDADGADDFIDRTARRGHDEDDDNDEINDEDELGSISRDVRSRPGTRSHDVSAQKVDKCA